MPRFRSVSIGAARGALLLAGAAMLALHILQPHLDPVHQPVSFYVHGDFGWLFPLSLGAFGLAAIMVPAAPRDRPWLVWFGGGMISAALIPSDQYFPWEGVPTWHGLAHAAVAVLAPPLLLVPLLRASVRSRAAALLLIAYAAGLLACTISLVAGLLLDRAPPHIGWAERLLAVAAVAWLWRAPTEISGRSPHRPA